MLTLGQLAAIRAIVTIHGGVNRAALVAALDAEIERERMRESHCQPTISEGNALQWEA